MITRSDKRLEDSHLVELSVELTTEDIETTE
ncbi:MAG: hypothetical protein QOJ64_978 [Acidobacteriota bacterium]|nr:hypothetical protein [Acidobacteriota bacterium]